MRFCNSSKTIAAVAAMVLLFVSHLRAQEPKVDPGLLTDSAMLAMKWDVQPVIRGSIMYLDVPYVRHDSTALLTLTVAKDRREERPSVFSVMLPEPVEQAKGLHLAFAARLQKPDGHYYLQIDTTTRTHLGFQDCNTDFCTARMKDGYTGGRAGVVKADIFADMMKYDHLVIVYFDSTGHQNILVPLASFKKQFKALE